MPLTKSLTSVGLAVLIACSPTLLPAAPRDVSHSTSAELRMGYLNKLLESKSGRRLALHNNGQTKLQIDKMIDQAHMEMAAGKHEEADHIAKSALKAIMTAMRELPENPEETARFKNRYETMHQGLEKFTHAQKNNKERFADEENSAKEYNHKQVDALIQKAETLAQQSKYEQAVIVLTEAQSILTSSLQGLLNNKQLVIELDISTPEKEYAYELRRYLGYEPLIPIAIEVKLPGEMAANTMLKMADKAKWMAGQARIKATEEDYPIAIRMVMDATKVLKQALRMAGVYM